MTARVVPLEPRGAGGMATVYLAGGLNHDPKAGQPIPADELLL